uniref:Importin N-terminal domain-containing protein n=1 Tax=Globisporangium ultimum (strain ATCC 200006 / CBS 805.95 / DAOM BR144) TaxID=431595 RepID=K3XCD1_GLOUD
MATEAPLAMVLGAIQALYGMDGVVRQREANEFLIAFAASEASWGVGLQLLLDASLNLAPEALFFAANMLHTKTRREWVKVPVERRPAFTASIAGLLQDLQSGRRPFHAALFNKLCAIYAVTLISSPDECKALLETLTKSTATADRAQLLFFLTLARCVCEEMTDAEISFTAKDAMESHLHTIGHDVTQAVAAIIAMRDNAQVVDLHSEAFNCLSVWIKKAGLSLTTLFLNDQVLLFTLIEVLCTKSKYLPICAEILCNVVTVVDYPRPADQENALRATANGLLKTRAACESALAEEEDEISHAITDVVSTFCETYVDWIVEGSAEETVALGHMMLFLGAHPRRQIASLTLEFWLLIQEEPVAERHVFFQRNAYIQLFEVLLRQCKYPHDADSMDELELDDLLAFRNGSQGVSDAFLAIFALLSEQVLDHLVSILAAASTDPENSWQDVEACLFALSIIADDVKKRLSSGANAVQLDAIVTQIFQLVLSASSPHVLVVTMAAKLLGQFGAWFNKKATASRSLDVITAILQYLDNALSGAQSCSNAARSFMQITTCSDILAQMATPDCLVASLQNFNGLNIEDRLLVVEGLVRAAVVSPHCSIILQAVLGDSLARLDQALVGQVSANGNDMTPIVVGNELQVLSKVVRFMDAPSEVAGGKAVTSSAVQHIWPHLEPIAPRLSHHEAVMDALFQFYGWCLQSLRDDMASQLGSIASLIVHVFEKHQFVSPLGCASVAVDIFGKTADANEQVLTSFRELMGMLSRTSFQFFTTHSLGDAPDVLRSFYELAYRFLLFCPAAVITSSEFPVLIELSLACLGNQDRGSTNAVLMFLTFLVNESRGKLAHFQASIDDCVLGQQGQLEKWIDGILSALATKSPNILFDSMGKLFFAVLSTFAEVDVVQTVLQQAMTVKSDALGLSTLSQEDRQRVFELWMRLALAPTRQAERRFRGLCSDFAKISRKELTIDALETYEWDT